MRPCDGQWGRPCLLADLSLLIPLGRVSDLLLVADALAVVRLSHKRVSGTPSRFLENLLFADDPGVV
jgi:hypothetical protein